MENAVARYDMTQDAMTPDSVVKQVVLIQDVMARVMKLDEHYGTIPGTKKPSLYKAGAEKLSLTFRLAPAYEVLPKELPNGHREYYVKCTLTHIPTGKIFGEGVGACSTMEGKYRFRTGEVEFTGQDVPKDFWKERDIKLIGGKGFSTKKNPDTGKWEIVRAGEKVEHDNPADYYNTVLKMAKKRAHVDAVLTATAASDIFTQDVEDMPEVIDIKPTTTKPAHDVAPQAPEDVNDDKVMPEGESSELPLPGKKDYTNLTALKGYDRGMAVWKKEGTFKCEKKTVQKSHCNDCPFNAMCEAWV